MSTVDEDNERGKVSGPGGEERSRVTRHAARRRRTNLRAIGAVAGAAILLIVGVVGPTVVKHRSYHSALDANLATAASSTPQQSPAGSPSPTEDPSPTASAWPKATPTPRNRVSECKIIYAVTGIWPGGMSVNVTIYNSGSTQISGWTVKWTSATSQMIMTIWNASFTQRGSSVTVTNVSYNPTIGANGGFVTFGFLANARAFTIGKPTHATLNGASCVIA